MVAGHISSRKVINMIKPNETAQLNQNLDMVFSMLMASRHITMLKKKKAKNMRPITRNPTRLYMSSSNIKFTSKFSLELITSASIRYKDRPQMRYISVNSKNPNDAAPNAVLVGLMDIFRRLLNKK